MNVADVKEKIRGLTKNVTEDNASSIASSLNELNQFIHEQFSNSGLVNHFEQLSGKIKGNIKTLEEDNRKLSQEIDVTEALVKQEEEIRKKHELLIIEKERRRAIKEKKKAIEEFSQIQIEVLDLEKMNAEAIQANIEKLKRLNVVLSNANAALEKDFGADVLTAEKNLSAIQKNQINILERLSNKPLEKFESQFSKDVEKLETDYNRYVEKINQHRTKQEAIIALFKAHHSENINIHDALKKRNESLGDLETLNREVKERLARYDNEIKDLVENRELLPIFQLAEARKYQ